MDDQEVKAPGAEADHVRLSAEVKNAHTYRGRSLTHELWEGVANSVPLSYSCRAWLARTAKSLISRNFKPGTGSEFVFFLGLPRLVMNP